MVFFFSGTGNSRYVAGRLSEALGENLRFIPETDAHAVRFTGKDLGFVFPVYSWGVPPLVTDFIANLTDEFISSVKKSGARVWMVCTCGDEAALTPDMFRKSIEARGLRMDGAWSVIMPNNYVLLPGFNVDSKEIEQKKLKAAPERIDSIADAIRNGKMNIDVVKGGNAWLKSRIIFPLFRRFGIFPRKWRFTHECVKCERCSIVCPTRNIKIHGGYPVWGNNCVSCLACYHNCPTHSVAYGNATNFKGQYVCPKK